MLIRTCFWMIALYRCRLYCLRVWETYCLRLL